MKKLLTAGMFTSMLCVVLGCKAPAPKPAAPGAPLPQAAKEAGPNVTALEDMRVIHETAPDWVPAPGKYALAQPNTVYFVGAGAPQFTLGMAGYSSTLDGWTNIARYIGEIAAVKWQKTNADKELLTSQPVGGVAEEMVRRALLASAGKRGSVAETYRERVGANYQGKPAVLFRVYQLVGVTKADLLALAKESAAQVAEESKLATDKTRLAQLAQLGTLLGGLTAEDFK